MERVRVIETPYSAWEAARLGRRDRQVQAGSRAEVGESLLERRDRVRHDGVLAVCH